MDHVENQINNENVEKWKKNIDSNGSKRDVKSWKPVAG